MQSEQVAAQAVAEMAVAVEQCGYDLDRARPLLDAFRPAFAEAKDLIAQSLQVTVTDATQVSEIKQSRALRLKLKAVRVGAEKVRKDLKDDALRHGKAIDGLANVLKYMIEPAEKRLLDQEEFAERIEAERKAKTKAAREELLAPFGIDTSFYQLGEMTEAVFAHLLDSTRTAHEAKLAAERKAEADRLEAEKAKAAEEKRIRDDNERLRLEAVAREKAVKDELERLAKASAAAEAKARKEREAIEAKAKAEREKAEAEAQKQREAKEKLEREIEQAKAREAEAKRAAEAKAAKAARAPDAEKLKALAARVEEVELPACATPDGKRALALAQSALEACSRRILELAKEL